MQRREVLRLLGSLTAGSMLTPLSPDRLYALGRETHRRLAQRAPPHIFDPHQHETVATVAELIIPETDTPGARAAGVGEFIDLMVAEWYGEEERARFLEGIATLDRRSQAIIGRLFVEAPASDQAQVLSELEGELSAFRAGGGEPGRHFFHQIKHLTLYGYYTSRVGLDQELRWSAVPGRYDPCLATGVGGREPR
jgi:gluconate 2-dehydrogenase gamma chain